MTRERVKDICRHCQISATFNKSDDGFFYCATCNAQADDIFDTGIDQDRFFLHYDTRKSRPLTYVSSSDPDDIIQQPSFSNDKFSSQCHMNKKKKLLHYDDFYTEIRSRYLMGLQVMIQLICKSLVDKFNVSPLIIGFIGPIWLRFLASTGVMSDGWADQAVLASEAHIQVKTEEEFELNAKYHGESVNINGKRLVMIWYRSLSNNIPISSSLSISFLVCHLAREAILPSDIVRWALEGKLPYLNAFTEIEKNLESKPEACPISVESMFRPIQAISVQELEYEASVIANKIGLQLPPVNFHAVASRYCSQLCDVPTSELILSMACQICEWSTPPELYLSANRSRIPTRVCVMSILIVAIRILFDINGYGVWESSLSTPKSETPASELSAVELLQSLEAKYGEIDDAYDYSRDLGSYIEYCKDVVFCGLKPSFEDLEEENLMTDLWEFYKKNNKVTSRLEDEEVETFHGSTENAIIQMKLEMEENKFCYIPPRARVKQKDYLHYTRRREDFYVYAVHADYYILLGSCAKVAQVETRIMHDAVLNFERRLDWLENKIDDSLNFLTQSL